MGILKDLNNKTIEQKQDLLRKSQEVLRIEVLSEKVWHDLKRQAESGFRVGTYIFLEEPNLNNIQLVKSFCEKMDPDTKFNIQDDGYGTHYMIVAEW